MESPMTQRKEEVYPSENKDLAPTGNHPGVMTGKTDPENKVPLWEAGGLRCRIFRSPGRHHGTW
jgi:hypothetical protein